MMMMSAALPLGGADITIIIKHQKTKQPWMANQERIPGPADQHLSPWRESSEADVSQSSGCENELGGLKGFDAVDMDEGNMGERIRLWSVDGSPSLA